MQEAVGAWKLQIPEEKKKNMASLAQTKLCLPSTLLASELKGRCVTQQYAGIWATYTHLISLQNYCLPCIFLTACHTDA